MEIGDNIFGFIKTQEANYKKPIPINRVWDWSMFDHIELSELYKNSQLVTGKDELKPIRNIVKPILNLQYRTEDIDVKDVQIYVNDANKYHLSFLVKKYHDDVFVVENDLDTFFDQLNESRIDFGAGLSKKLNDPTPEVVPMQSIVFCDQTDMLSGPIGIKHFYSPDQLLEMTDVGWGNEANGATIGLKELITLSRTGKRDEADQTTADTPGRYIEVYEIHGNLPKQFADSNDTSEEYETRLWIVAFYQKEKGSDDKEGVILYTKPETESPFKLIKRDPVHGRALGFGGVEELFEAQAWTTYDMIRMQGMLDSASKTILGAKGSNSSTIATRSRTDDLDNNEILDLGDGDLVQVNTYPRNIALFKDSLEMWDIHGKDMGSAQDPIQGKQPSSGTPFASLQEQVRQGMGMHDFRRGQFAKHLEEIYKDWIIPHIAQKITQGAKFLSELDVEELNFVADKMVINESNKFIKEQILNGQLVSPEEIDAQKETTRETFKKKGSKHFLEILKGEFKKAPLAVKVNIAGKQKDLNLATEKVVNIFKFAFSNPQGFAQTMQIPGMSKAFNKILEFSGMSEVDFSGIAQLGAPQPQQLPEKGAPQGAIDALAPEPKAPTPA